MEGGLNEKISPKPALKVSVPLLVSPPLIEPDDFSSSSSSFPVCHCPHPHQALHHDMSSTPIALEGLRGVIGFFCLLFLFFFVVVFVLLLFWEGEGEPESGRKIERTFWSCVDDLFVLFSSRFFFFVSFFCLLRSCIPNGRYCVVLQRRYTGCPFPPCQPPCPKLSFFSFFPFRLPSLIPTLTVCNTRR